MPDLHHTPSIAAVCVILCGLVLASPVAADFLGGSLISSSTSISGNVVVNETVSVKKIAYSDGFPKIQEWTFQETIVNPGSRSWTTEMTFVPQHTGTKFSFSKTGNLFFPFSFTI
jgi:hypothetical protein